MAIIETYKGPSLELGLNKKKFILFDFDGVIVDSFAPAMEVNKMICPNITENEYRKRFEGNINDRSHDDFVHDEKCNHSIDFFTEYIPRMKNVGIVAGMDEVIKTLAQSYTLIVISSTLSAPIQELLEKFNLAQYFTEIMGTDVHKSKVEKIKMVFQKYSTSSKECVFITDTLGDMREALQTEVATIGVSWGFHTQETLLKGQPFKIVESSSELVPTITQYFNHN